MEQIVFDFIKKELSAEKNRWHAGIGLFDNVKDENEEIRLADEKKPGTFRLGVFFAVCNYLRISKAVEYKKIKNQNFYKWTPKLDEMV